MSPPDLTGTMVRVPTKSGRGVWTVEVLEQRGDFLRVGRRHHNHSCGRPWWTHKDQVTPYVRPRRYGKRALTRPVG